MDETVAASLVDDREIGRRVLHRLRQDGAECLSHLAVELCVSPKLMLGVLAELERSELVHRKKHRRLGAHLECLMEEGEERWGARF